MARALCAVVALNHERTGTTADKIKMFAFVTLSAKNACLAWISKRCSTQCALLLVLLLMLNKFIQWKHCNKLIYVINGFWLHENHIAKPIHVKCALVCTVHRGQSNATIVSLLFSLKCHHLFERDREWYALCCGAKLRKLRSEKK